METFGRYTLLELAGQGGMAQVHLARQIGPGGFVKPCVVKRIAPEHAGDERVRRMFLEEARVSALLNHRNVVHTFDFGEVDGVPFMAMELVDGVNLAQLLRHMAKSGRWIALGPAVDIVREVLVALEYAHGLEGLDGKPLELVHRDVSPQNILLSRSGDVKLSDFGIARHEARDQHTQAHAPKGKPGYMAPEQALGTGMDGRADLFSLGIVLVELISARRVLASGQKIVSVTDLGPRLRELVDLRNEAPESLRGFALRLAALDVSVRPANAREAIEALDAIRPDLPPSRTLPSFLERVFAKYFPVTVAATSESPSSASLPKVALEEAAGTPAPSDEQEMAVDETAWAPAPDEAEATATVLTYQGWPEEFAPDAPPPLVLGSEAPPVEPPPGMLTPLGLVSRSSNVDAMKDFAPEFSEEAAQRGTKDVDRADPDDTSTELSEDSRSPKSGTTAEDPERPRLPLVPIVLGGTAVVLFGLGIVSLLAPDTEPPAPAVTHGDLRVTSTPPGAEILIDGRPVGEKTPTVLESLPVETEMRVAVRLKKHLPIPLDVVVSIPRSTAETSASFTLKRGRAYRLTTAPEGAQVEVNGRRLPDVTPLELPVVPFQESATVAIRLSDHLPVKLVLHGKVDTATVHEVTLEPAKVIDIVSNPVGADVYLDREKIGQTPVYDVRVPERRRFTVVVTKQGFKRQRQRLRGRQLDDRQLVINLEPLPLLAMPMSPEQRTKARKLDQRLAQVSRTLKREERALEKLERRLEMVSNSGTVFVGDIAEAQRAVDDTRSRIDALTEEQADLQSEIDLLRQDIVSKLD